MNKKIFISSVCFLLPIFLNSVVLKKDTSHASDNSYDAVRDIPIQQQKKKLKISYKKMRNTDSGMRDDQRNFNNFEETFEESLIQNAEASELDLLPDWVDDLLAADQFLRVMYADANSIKSFYPDDYAAAQMPNNKTLYLMNLDYAKGIAHDRSLVQLADSMSDVSDDVIDDLSVQSSHQKKIRLAYDDFDISFFSAGTRHDGSTLTPVASNLRAALMGPDYSFDDFSPTDDQQVRRHLSTILPLGHNGLLVLQVGNGGSILASGGIDFIVYQTTFRILGTNTLWQKFAYLGVSNDLDINSVVWFPCAPSQGDFRGCVGVLPTEEGGDAFKLSDIGVSRAKYIWIKDIGTNFSMPSKWPTDGCAIDAVILKNSYVLML